MGRAVALTMGTVDRGMFWAVGRGAPGTSSGGAQIDRELVAAKKRGGSRSRGWPTCPSLHLFASEIEL